MNLLDVEVFCQCLMGGVMLLAAVLSDRPSMRGERR